MHFRNHLGRERSFMVAHVATAWPSFQHLQVGEGERQKAKNNSLFELRSEGTGWGKRRGMEHGRVPNGFLVLEKLPLGLAACANN